MTQLISGPLCGWPAERMLVLENESHPGNLPDRLITALTSPRWRSSITWATARSALTTSCASAWSGRGRSPGAAGNEPAVLRRQAGAARQRHRHKDRVLDCCFAGLASGPASTLTGSASRARPGDRRRSVHDGRDLRTHPRLVPGRQGAGGPQTFFTKHLVDLIEEGIPGSPPGCGSHLVPNVERGWPSTSGRFLRAHIDSARDFAFARNCRRNPKTRPNPIRGSGACSPKRRPVR